MPELPEVETIRQDLRKIILNKKIIRIEIKSDKVVKNKPFFFSKNLLGSKFIEIDRIGKLLIFVLDKYGRFMVCHLRMTGQLVCQKENKFSGGGHPTSYLNLTKLPNQFTHVIISFVDKTKLFFNDTRQFGYLMIIDIKKLEKIKGKYGIEPLTENFTFDNFIRVLNKKKKSIKSILLDQTLISGIGNIYADEICFASGVLPMRSVNSLTKKEIISLYKNCEKILEKAIKKRGTSFRDYVDADGKRGNFVSFLNVYGRESLKCKICKIKKIEKLKFSGRGTRFCLNCQK